jgi:Malectin domain
VEAPIAAPVEAPIAAPVEAPIAAPITAPVEAPITAPVEAPVAQPPVTTFFAVRVNAGSNTDWTDPQGLIWEADNYFVGNKGDQYGQQCLTDISGTENDNLYCSERYFNIWAAYAAPYLFEIPVPHPTGYKIRLHFAETYFTTPLSRQFDVWVDGFLVVASLDIVSEVGPRTALVLEVVREIKGGSVAIELVPRIENPKINAIEVIEIVDFVPSPPTPPVASPVATPTPVAGPVASPVASSPVSEDVLINVGGNGKYTRFLLICLIQVAASL